MGVTEWLSIATGLLNSLGLAQVFQAGAVCLVAFAIFSAVRRLST